MRGNAETSRLSAASEYYLGQSQPILQKIIYKAKEHWNWFDCRRQLGTNGPDTPKEDAVVDAVDIREGDIVLAVSDGVSDNLWENNYTRYLSCERHRKSWHSYG